MSIKYSIRVKIPLREYAHWCLSWKKVSPGMFIPQGKWRTRYACPGNTIERNN